MRNRTVPGLSIPVVLLVGLLVSGLLGVAACNPQPLPHAPTPIPALPPATLPVEVAVEAALRTEGATPEPAEQHGDTSPNDAEVNLDMGKQVFEARCAICHSLSPDQLVGPGLAGMFGRPSLPNGNPVDDDAVRAWIINGGGSMPGVPLGDADMSSLIGFLKDATE